MEQNALLEEKKKEEYIKRAKEAEERKKELDKLAEIEQEKKRILDHEK